MTPRGTRAAGGATHPAIAISVEAGAWPPAAALQAIAERAIGAAAATLAASGDDAADWATDGATDGAAELSLVFTDDAAIAALNKAWRGKDGPTNVLSFPVPPQPGAAADAAAARLLGDVILAAEAVAREAALAEKPLEDHMAHLIIHGFLHLLGYTHDSGPEAEKMEQLERVALKRIGIPDPYAAARGR